MKSLKQLAALKVAKGLTEEFDEKFRMCKNKLQEEMDRHEKVLELENRLHRENLRMLIIANHKERLGFMQVDEKFHDEILSHVLSVFMTQIKRRRYDKKDACLNLMQEIFVDKTDDGELVFSSGDTVDYLKYDYLSWSLNIYHLFMNRIQFTESPLQMSISDILFSF